MAYPAVFKNRTACGAWRAVASGISTAVPCAAGRAEPLIGGQLNVQQVGAYRLDEIVLRSLQYNF